MYRGNLLQSRDRGSALAMVMIFVILLTVSSIGVMRLGLAARGFSVRTSDKIAARVAADAGLVKAVWQLNQNVQAIYSAKELPRQTDQTLPSSTATFSYEVAIPTGSAIRFVGAGASEKEVDPANVRLPYSITYVIKSVGKSGNAEKVLYAAVRLKGLFESAFLSKGRISLQPNTLITGYNSADPTDTGLNAKIGTLSIDDDQISLSPGTVVEADVFVGVGGNPNKVIGAGGTITGQEFALTEPVKFPVITVPALPNIGTVISAKGATVKRRPGDSGTYKGISLSSKADLPGVLEIDGGDVVLHLTGDIDLGNNAEIIVRANSSLALYIDGDIAAKNSAGFVNENSPLSTLKIFATGQGVQSFELKAKSEAFGIVYAPNADVELYSKAELYGAIVARNIDIKSKGIFKYDKALRVVNSDDEGVRFVIESWWD